MPKISAGLWKPPPPPYLARCTKLIGSPLIDDYVREFLRDIEANISLTERQEQWLLWIERFVGEGRTPPPLPRKRRDGAPPRPKRKKLNDLYGGPQ
jgi:hypothetical protein